MRYGREIVENTLDELGIEVSDYESSGWRSALCPLHEDSSPSFTILMDEGAWKCRSGCGSSGDLAELVSKITGDDVKTCRRKLRLKISSDPTKTLTDFLVNRRGEEEEEERKPEPLFYERSRVPSYMIKSKKEGGRAFPLAFLKEWEVGYDPELNSVVIPFKSQGKLVGLIRRNLGEGPKYLNSSGLAKSDHLFGLDKISTAERYCVVVEGPLDCMWLHLHGYPSVAILGSSMTQKQADILKRRFWKIVLAFDNDNAGEKAFIQSNILLKPTEIIRLKLPWWRNDIQDCSKEELKEAFEDIDISI